MSIKQVTTRKTWKKIFLSMGANPNSTSAATYTRRKYESYVVLSYASFINNYLFTIVVFYRLLLPFAQYLIEKSRFKRVSAKIPPPNLKSSKLSEKTDKKSSNIIGKKSVGRPVGRPRKSPPKLTELTAKPVKQQPSDEKLVSCFYIFMSIQINGILIFWY